MKDWLDSWTKDKRRKGKEKLTERLNLIISLSEKQWIDEQSLEECTSANSIVRKAVKMYREYTQSLNKD